ncbi:MAG: tetratricopeptide repeat protein [Clostridia bacterium]
MQNKLFKILNLQDDATSSEIEQAYNAKRSKLREDMFLEGRAGNEAARDLTVLENTYSDYLNEIRFAKNKTQETSADNMHGSSVDVFADIEAFVKAGKLNEAQELLDNIQTRDDKWHFHQAMVYFKKDWFTDSKKHLEKAMELNPNNEKYKSTYDKLTKMMSGKTGEQNPNKKQGEEWWKQNDTLNNDKDTSQPNWDDNNRQMGGCDESMNCCTQLLCMNLLCNCCGGGGGC